MSVVSVEHTLAIIKPEGMANERKIISKMKKAGFIIINKRTIHLTPEQASDFYREEYGKTYFPLLIASTSIGPVTVLCLGKKNAVEDLKILVGPSEMNKAKEENPKSLNAQFGNVECNLNAVHASANLAAAEKEMHFFFPISYTDPMQVIADNLDYLQEHVKPLLKEGFAQLAKEKPAEPLIWLAHWLLQNNPNKPKVEDHLLQNPM